MQRLMLYGGLVLVTSFFLQVNEALKDYSEKRFATVAFNGDTLIVDMLSPQNFRILAYAETGKSRDIMGAFFDELFLTEKDWVQFGAKGLRDKGLGTATSPAETACIVFGCMYEIELFRMYEQGLCTEREFFALQKEARRFSQRRRYWNCVHREAQHISHEIHCSR